MNFLSVLNFLGPGGFFTILIIVIGITAFFVSMFKDIGFIKKEIYKDIDFIRKELKDLIPLKEKLDHVYNSLINKGIIPPQYIKSRSRKQITDIGYKVIKRS